jgi:hypothetical protein
VRRAISVRLAALLLFLSDALVGLLVWLAAYELQSIFVRWGDLPRQTVVVVVVFAVAVWIGLRYLMGLYPGDTLSRVQRLLRHTCSVALTIAAVAFVTVLIPLGFITTTFLPIDLVGQVERPLLVLGFVGLLLLAPPLQVLTRRRLGI